MAKILMVLGSLHKNGFQEQLAKEIEKQIGDRAEVSFLDYKDVPFMNQDIEFPAPASVEAAREAFKAADGVWFVTPVYNHTTSPLTLNLLDWLSRPLEVNVRETAVSNGVKVTFSSASAPGAYTEMFADVVKLANQIGMDVLDAPLFGHGLTGEWMTGELALDEAAHEAIEAQITAFLAKIAE
ncbi:NADPH-dependent FMN reductase [Alloscardovia macacae]|uniref:Flavin reductase n=1 Tax=Alloscardovia macacae TaxID=1160091 RepID=A0A261F6W1_9BIFI|nr:NAD(P)H-dependent oxidoreductase [Alloscardovia macacae]OZG54824.1 flavin reductase [Alloscardovia macacae]